MPENNQHGTAIAVAEIAAPGELARELTLFQIEESLVLLAEAAEEEDVTPELEQALIRYLEGAVEKRDRVAEFILFCEAMESLAKAEVKRLQARQKRFATTRERVSAMALRVLDFLRVTKLEGKTHTLKKRKCPPSVQILEEEKIPAAYKRITVTLPLPEWETLLRNAPEHLQQSVASNIRKQEVAQDLEAIKQALNLEKKVEGADLVVNKFTLHVS